MASAQEPVAPAPDASASSDRPAQSSQATPASEPAEFFGAGPSAVSTPAAVSAPPAESHFALGVETSTVWLKSESFDLFSDNDVSRYSGLWAAYDLLRIQPASAMSVELGWNTASNDAPLQEIVRANLRVDSYYAAFSMRHRLWSWLTPHVRAVVGANRLEMDLTSGATGSRHGPSLLHYGDTSWSALGSLGAGVALETPGGLLARMPHYLARLRLGLLVEGGYRLSTSAEARLVPQNLGKDVIEPQVASLGSIALSGAYLRLSFYARL